MKAIVVGSGAGGATAARKLAENGYEVTLLEAGKPFSPLTHKVSWLSGLRGSFLLKDAGAIKHFFPHYGVDPTGPDLTLFRGITEGGSTSISCGNMVRAENGLKEIGLDLTAEFEEIERSLKIEPIPRERWRPLTQQMFDKAQELGYSPNPTPKVGDLDKCVGCGYCELGCIPGARWDSRRLYSELLGKGVTLKTGSPVQKVLLDGNRAVGVESQGERFSADVVVLSAGGVGTAQILKASNLQAKDSLWVDIVLTVGGIKKGARMLNEPPMVWVIKKDNYILAPYFDILSYWFHRPWKNVAAEDRVGMMIKLADSENGAVSADGTVTKKLSQADIDGLEAAKVEAKRIMDASSVSGPFVDGLVHGGHLGGTVPLSRADVESMHPASLAEGLWVADLSLLPRSQGLPTMLTTAALSMRVSTKIIEENSKR
jgi:choline dehydrogenase-like flavoprotein